MPFASPRAATFAGARHACGAPLLALAASYLGFGSLVRAAGFDLSFGLLSTATAWALPGQMALVEAAALGTGVLVAAAAVALANVRLWPMAMTLAPLLRDPARPRWQFYAASLLVAITGWVQAMRVCPTLPVEQRLPYFVGFAGTLWAGCLAATAAGYLLVEAMPVPVALGLVFLNPLYFVLVLTADLRQRARLLAMGLGAVIGPILHLVSPDWGLLLTGLLAGTAGFVLDRAAGDRRTARGTVGPAR